MQPLGPVAEQAAYGHTLEENLFAAAHLIFKMEDHTLFSIPPPMANHHIIMFPFMAQGHINPFISFANLIEQQTQCTVTFVSTPLNVVKIRASLSENSAIRFAELPFSSSDHGMPADIENTDKVPFHLFTAFFHATLFLQSSFEQLVLEIVQQNHNASVCIIADVFLGWTVETAKKFQVPHYVFITSGAYGAATFLSMCMNPPRAITSALEVALVDYPEVKLPQSLVLETIFYEDEVHPIVTFIGQQVSLSFQSQGLLINTVAEFEKVGISLLQKRPGLPNWAIGPLLRLPPVPPRNTESYATWLDYHPPGSVLYVSFGSQNSILASQMMDLAMGLEASGKPFIWVIRPPLDFGAVGEFRAEWLPKGFEDRMRDKMQGLLVHGWAPQLEILSHPSTGAFLSHCGWNSVQESLSSGLPIIGWPLFADQGFNARMLEELGVCVKIPREKVWEGVEGGWEGVASSIELVMGGTRKGREMRTKALDIKEVMIGALKNDGGLMGSSLKAVEDFLHTMFLSKFKYRYSECDAEPQNTCV